MKRGNNPIKARQPSLTLKQVSLYPVITSGPHRHIQSQIPQMLKSAARTRQLREPGGVLKLVQACEVDVKIAAGGRTGYIEIRNAEIQIEAETTGD